ncbi:MAG TPA: glycosyltransferase family 9 protein [Gemmatimonadaceae bacterium]|nr:glycosyltransferase family 9 protein [Gemmatimonadaceae bacterium]
MIHTPLRRICVVMMSAIGDAVHVLPVITALKRHAPHAHITWVLQPGPASLVRGHPAVDEIVLFDPRRGWKALLDVRRSLAQRRTDLLLDLQVYAKAGLVTLLAKAPVKLGFDRARARDLNWLATTHRIPPHAPQHVQDQYFEFLDVLGIPHEPVEWGLGPWESERGRQREFLARLDRPAATLVIGSSHRQKEWLAERWAELVDVLAGDFGLQPVLAGGASDRERRTAQIIRERAHHEPISTLGVPLRELVGVLDASALVISLDTAPLHMAVALGRPVVSLMGYNSPKRVGPYRRFHDLLVDAYGDPGEDYPISMAHRLDRMPRIRVRDVVEKVERWRECYARA